MYNYYVLNWLKLPTFIIMIIHNNHNNCIYYDYLLLGLLLLLLVVLGLSVHKVFLLGRKKKSR